jgi:CheY-like chemotaxis protein
VPLHRASCGLPYDVEQAESRGSVTLFSLFTSSKDESKVPESAERRNRIVLSVGILPELLSLRAAVLQSAGYSVVTVPPQEAAARVRKGDCGVLLLCYSVSDPFRKQLVREFRKRCPHGRIIAITNSPVLETPNEVDDLVYGVEGPEVLLDVIKRNEA